MDREHEEPPRLAWELTPEEEGRADRLYWEAVWAGDDE